MGADKRCCVMEIALDGIDEMEDMFRQFPERMPKNASVKNAIWAAHHFHSIYKILFYILTRTK